MIARALIGVAALLSSPTARAEPPALARPLPADSETVWSKWLAQELDGIAEYRAPAGSRVDVLTADVAWEVDWCKTPKVYEAVGQALYYRAATGRKGGVVLLMGKGNAWTEYLAYTRCLVACREAGLRLRVVNVQPKPGKAQGV